MKNQADVIEMEKPQPLIKNKNLMLLFSGKSISIIGDAFFDLAVMWVVYAQSGSTLQSALVGVVSQLAQVLVSPIAGAYADRWNRKTILWLTNLISALVVSLIAITYFKMGYLPLLVALLSILVLNSLDGFMSPAESSVLPDIVGKEKLSSAYGVLSTVTQVANLIGKGIAGFVIVIIGSGWALTGDSLSFILVSLCIIATKIPKFSLNQSDSPKSSSLLSELKSGFKYINQLPVLKNLIWLAFFVNISSFMGPLYPALVKTQLHGSAGTYGITQVFIMVGAILGGLSVGFFEKRFSAGIVIGFSLLIASFSTVGIAISQNLFVTIGCQVVQNFFTTVCSVLAMSAVLVLVSDEFRGRVMGLVQAIAILAMPVSTLVAGAIGNTVKISYLFTFGAMWIFGVAIFAFISPAIRKLSLNGRQQSNI